MRQAAWVFVALAGCNATDEVAPWPAGVALISNLSQGSWSWGSPTGTSPFLSAADIDPSCADCIGFQGRLRTGADGETEAVLTWSQHDGGEDDLRSRAGGVDVTTNALRWQIDSIDLSGFPGVCTPDPADPCRPAEDATGAARGACQLKMAHDVQVVNETEYARTLWIADAANARVLEVVLEDGARCGVVQTVLDATNADWDVYNSPNRLHWFEDDAGAHLWITQKGSTPSTVEGVAQYADISSGKLTAWTKTQGAWGQDWEFPPQSTEAASFLHTPHGLSAPGDSLVYAHSLSDSWEWGAGTGGSIGIAALDSAGMPVYAGDARLDRGYLHFPRSVTPLPDGSYLVLDSGCFDAAGCEFPSQAWRVRLPEPQPAAQLGSWDRDSTQLNWTTAQVLDGPLWTTKDTLYSVEWLDS